MAKVGDGAVAAGEGISGMSETLLGRVWAWLHETFPERQIYIRSDGRVQFFTFGPSLQATLAGLILIFLGWVAFATVNVVFKDRIIAAKDHRYQQMQAAYENRVSDAAVVLGGLRGRAGRRGALLQAAPRRAGEQAECDLGLHQPRAAAPDRPPPGAGGRPAPAPAPGFQRPRPPPSPRGQRQ